MHASLTSTGCMQQQWDGFYSRIRKASHSMVIKVVKRRDRSTALMLSFWSTAAAAAAVATRGIKVLSLAGGFIFQSRVPQAAVEGRSVLRLAGVEIGKVWVHPEHHGV